MFSTVLTAFVFAVWFLLLKRDADRVSKNDFARLVRKLDMASNMITARANIDQTLAMEELNISRE